METTTTLSGLLDGLGQSVCSALEIAPKLGALLPVQDGVSLLDAKNELLLSYLQHLVFLIILKLRAAQKPAGGSDSMDEHGGELRDSVTRKLVELRLYLEKGARPLEDKMRFQIERLVRAADEADRKAAAEASKNGVVSEDEEGSEGEEEEDGDGDEDDDQNEDEDEDVEAAAAARPRLSNLIAQRKKPSPSSRDDAAAAADPEPNDGIYRPPRRERQLMEEDAAARARRREKTERRPHKSATIDEFIAGEMSSMPVAEPSIGTNVEGRGRRVKTAAERAVEAERRNYEESNFVRLPKESNKEKARKQGGRRSAFGGEDFHDISGQVDRINRLTRPRDGPRPGTVKALLEKSRKRGRDSTGGGDQAGIGERFQKKLKVMESGRRDRGRGRRS